MELRFLRLKSLDSEVYREVLMLTGSAWAFWPLLSFAVMILFQLIAAQSMKADSITNTDDPNFQ